MARVHFPAFLLLASLTTLPTFADGPRVVAVEAVDRLHEYPGALAPNHELELVVENLDQLCPGGRTSQPGKPLQVYLDGTPVPGAIPLSDVADPRGRRLRFFLPIGEETQPVWAWVARTTQVLDDPRVTVAVSVGYPDCAVPSQAQAMDGTMLVLRRSLAVLWVGMTLALGGLLVWLGRTTNLLRDPSPSRPYSLSKTQAAWWLYLILAGFSLVLMVTGFPPTLSNDALILLGLSSATGVAGGVLEGQRAQNVATGKASQQNFLGFWRDLLLDPTTGDISLGRLQFVAWTVLIGGYFAYRVVTTVTLPDLGNQLLLLQGLSAGTYVAAKTGEN